MPTVVSSFDFLFYWIFLFTVVLLHFILLLESWDWQTAHEPHIRQQRKFSVLRMSRPFSSAVTIKKYASTRSVFESFSPFHIKTVESMWNVSKYICTTSSYSEASVFEKRQLEYAKAPDSRFRVDEQKRRFLYTITSYIIQRTHASF